MSRGMELWVPAGGKDDAGVDGGVGDGFKVGLKRFVQDVGLHELFRGSVGDDLPLGEGHYSVEVGCGPIEVMRDGEGGELLLVAEVGEEFFYGFFLFGIEVGAGFVEDEDRAGLGESCRDAGFLPLSTAEGLEGSLGKLVEAGAFDDVVGGLNFPGVPIAEAFVVRVTAHEDELEDRERDVVRELLRDIGDLACELPLCELGQGLASESDVA